jgi:hypothetical protein
MRRIAATLAGLGLLATLAVAPVAAGGPPSVGFYANGDLYRTVGTPTDFSKTGAPAHSFDHIYALGNGLMNVAESAPGDRDFNGGRWMVTPVEWHTTPVQLTSDTDVNDYAEAGLLTILDPIRFFECPVIRIPGRH